MITWHRIRYLSTLFARTYALMGKAMTYHTGQNYKLTVYWMFPRGKKGYLMGGTGGISPPIVRGR